MNEPRSEFRSLCLIPVIALVALGTFTTHASASFGVGTKFAVGGGNPRHLIVADMNGDQKPDLVTAGSLGNAVSVMLGRGDGSVQVPSLDTTVGLKPRSVAAGDLNGDGKMDLVTANYDSDTVSILLGDGDGTFAPPTSFTTGSQPRSIAIGKFNADSIPDLVVADYSGAKIEVHFGFGSGAFTGPSYFPVELYPMAVGAGDFNGDGTQDIAVANSGGDSVSVLLATGMNSFGPAVRNATGSGPGTGLGPNSLAIADLTGDGNLDLATANTGSDDVTLLTGIGNGAFAPAKNSAAGNAPDGISVGKLTNDPYMDLAVTTPDANTASILPGSGSGTFGASAADLVTGGLPLSSVVGDLNGDRVPDLAVTNSMSDSVSIFLNQGPIGTVSPASLSFPEQTAGTTGAARTLTLTNTGMDPLTVIDTPVTGPAGGSFIVSGNDCSSSGLPTAGTCKLSVQFTPQAAGKLDATLNVDYNGTVPVAVPLSGTGTSVPVAKSKIKCKVAKKKKRGKVKSVKASCKVTPAAASAGKRYAWKLKKRGEVVRKGNVKATKGRVKFRIPGAAKLKKGKYRLTVKGGGAQSTSSLTL